MDAVWKGLMNSPNENVYRVYLAALNKTKNGLSWNDVQCQFSKNSGRPM